MGADFQCPYAGRGKDRCPEWRCDCFIDTHPDDPFGLHPEDFIVVGRGDENTLTVDHEKWGRLLYLLYREHTLYRGSRTMLPDWGDVEPKEQRAWMSDASEFIRAWEQKRQATTDVLSAAIRAEAWDEGYDVGNAPNPPDKRWNNPYRRGERDD